MRLHLTRSNLRLPKSAARWVIHLVIVTILAALCKDALHHSAQLFAFVMEAPSWLTVLTLFGGALIGLAIAEVLRRIDQRGGPHIPEGEYPPLG